MFLNVCQNIAYVIARLTFKDLIPRTAKRSTQTCFLIEHSESRVKMGGELRYMLTLTSYSQLGVTEHIFPFHCATFPFFFLNVNALH